MTQMAVATSHKPLWIDLATQDSKGSNEFYAKLFGWQIDVNPDPQYGGYARALLGGQDIAGIGAAQSPDQPTAWAFYVGTDDAEQTAKKVEAAGGKVIAAPFDVGDQGRMAVFQDPVGAFVSVWQPIKMGGFTKQGESASFSWAELNARGRDDALAFYQSVFGWDIRRSSSRIRPTTSSSWSTARASPAPPSSTRRPQPGRRTTGSSTSASTMSMGRSTRPSASAQRRSSRQDFPGGRFAIVTDPQGAVFGLLKGEPQG